MSKTTNVTATAPLDAIWLLDNGFELRNLVHTRWRHRISRGKEDR